VNVRLPTDLSGSYGCEREEEVLCRRRDNLKSHMLHICYVDIIWLIIGCVGMFCDTKKEVKSPCVHLDRRSIEKVVSVLSMYDIIYLCYHDTMMW
jgi:hypothetical protein